MHLLTVWLVTWPPPLSPYKQLLYPWLLSVSTVLVMGGCLHLVAAVGVLVTALAGAQAQDGGNKTGSK